MLKLAAVMVVAVVGSLAAPTTVTQSKITAGNAKDLASGKITITASAPFLAADGVWVDTTPLVVPVINGTFSTQLEPTDTGTPSVSYTATWQLDNAQQRKEFWLVSTSSSPLNLANVRVAVPPAVNVQINPAQIGQAGATVGQGMCWMGTSWAPGNCVAGTATCLQTVAWSATPTFDFAVCTQYAITLAGNVTPAIVHASYCEISGGCSITFVQGAGAYTVTWASSVTGGFQVGAVSGKKNVQSYTSIDGMNLVAIGPGVVNQ